MNIFEEFCAQLTEEERQRFFFQQDVATRHTSRVSLQRVHDVFSEEWTDSKNLWPPRSPNHTTSDYFLCRHLKSTVYESNPHTIQELKDNISHAVAAIKITMLHRVYLNMIRCAQLCTDTGGNHFQHLLWCYTLSAFRYCINFCIYTMLQTRATFAWPTLHIVAFTKKKKIMVCLFFGGEIKTFQTIYRVIHKSLRDFRTRLLNNQDRHSRKEHINR